jgi:hypothetical protein
MQSASKTHHARSDGNSLAYLARAVQRMSLDPHLARAAQLGDPVGFRYGSLVVRSLNLLCRASQSERHP